MSERSDRRHRSHSKSRSKSRRYRDDDYDDDYRRRSNSRSRSRSRSLERRKRRHHGRSRSHSRDKESRRYRKSKRYSRSTSRSRSRSRARSHRRRSGSRSSGRSQKHSNRYRSGSRSPNASKKHDSRHRSRSISKDGHKKNRHLSTGSDSNRSKTEETLTNMAIDQENSSTQYFSSNTNPDNLENLPLPEQAENSSNAEYYVEPDEPIDKERIHREMEEKLRAALAKEGKVYPPPKPEASHPVFANDGSFLEIFKKMQEAQSAAVSTAMTTVSLPTAASTSVAPVAASTSGAIKPTVPASLMVGRRRGGKILKTGVVAKPKVTANANEDKDFWSLYLAEVNKYKNHACESEAGNRPLLK